MKTSTTMPLRDRIGTPLRTSRAVILIEVLLLTLLVVLRAKSILILLLLIGWLSLWLRRSGWRNIGMGLPLNRWRTVLAGIGIGVAYQLFSIGILVPVLSRLTNTALDLSQLASLRGNLASLALWLTVSWTIAAFGEEMAYRGYLLSRLADLFGNSYFGWGIGIVVSAIFFGMGHMYQGITGILETFVFGATMACLYVATRRNLWLPIIVHGVNDTIGLALIFLGLYL